MSPTSPCRFSKNRIQQLQPHLWGIRSLTSLANRCSQLLLPALLSSMLAIAFCTMLASPVQAFFQFGEFTVEDERELGRKFEVLIRTKMPLIEDPEITEYVDELVQNIAKAMPSSPFKIKTYVIKHPAINAFAAPAGNMFIHSGLILNFEHESELAGVVAHELAHVYKRHLAQRIEDASIMSILTMVGMLAGVFLGGDEGAGLAIGSMAATQQAMLNFSREDEREADSVGVSFLVDAGYPPSGLTQGLEHIRDAAALSAREVPAYLSTHPEVSERIEHLKSREDLHRLNTSITMPSDDRFLRVKTLLRARYTDADVALAHFISVAEPGWHEYLGMGIAYERLKRFADSEEAFARAIELTGGQDALVLREAGRSAFENGDFPAAASRLQKALTLNPDDLMASFFYARLLGDYGETESAAYNFERILKKLPQDAEVHYYYGRMLGENGHLFDAHLHLAYSALYLNNQKDYKRNLKQAQQYVRGPREEEALEQLQAEYDERKELWDGGL